MSISFRTKNIFRGTIMVAMILLFFSSGISVQAAETLFTKSLSRGSSGDEVKKLQIILSQYPDIYPAGIVNGTLGPMTEAAVKAFQKKYKITSTGVVDYRTALKLDELTLAPIAKIPTSYPKPSGSLNTPDFKLEMMYFLVSLPIPILQPVGVNVLVKNLGASFNGKLLQLMVDPGSRGYVGKTISNCPAILEKNAVCTFSFNITYLTGGMKIFQVFINPAFRTAEQDYSNNARSFTIMAGSIPLSSVVPPSSPSSVQMSTSSTSTIAMVPIGHPVSTTTMTTATTSFPICGKVVRDVPSRYPSIKDAIKASSWGDTVRIAAGIFTEQVVMKSGLCLEGTGIYVTRISKPGSSAIVVDGAKYVVVRNISAQDSGGFRSGLDGDGGGIYINNSQFVKVESCRFSNNYVVNGGGIAVRNSADVELTRCLIEGNYAGGYGGGVYINDSEVVLTNMTLTGNSAAVAVKGLKPVAGVYIDSLQRKVITRNSILWHNKDYDWYDLNQISASSTHPVMYSNIRIWSDFSNGNISQSPEFVSPTDFRIKSTSPAVNAGDPAPAYKDPNGTRNDMGAFPISSINSSFTRNIAAILGFILENLKLQRLFVR